MTMSRHDGKALSVEEAIDQSVVDILTTPIGSRVMLRGYGSRVYRLLDRPLDKLALYVAIHEALAQWEPRIKLSEVRLVAGGDALTKAKDGRIEVELFGNYRAGLAPFRLKVAL